jgi:hypothetical protein
MHASQRSGSCTNLLLPVEKSSQYKPSVHIGSCTKDIDPAQFPMSPGWQHTCLEKAGGANGTRRRYLRQTSRRIADLA